MVRTSLLYRQRLEIICASKLKRGGSRYYDEVFLFRGKNISFYEEVIFMTNKQIEASREARLWIAQIIVPTVVVGAIVMRDPDIRRAVAEKVIGIKSFIRNKFKKN